MKRTIVIRNVLALAAFAALPAALAVVTGPAPAAQRVLHLSDLRKLVALGVPQFSPDGKRLAFVVRTSNYKKNDSRSQIVVVDVVTGARAALTRPSDDASDPRWSPDGRSIAYVAAWKADDDKATGSGESQIQVLRIGSGDPRAVTAAKHGVESFAWSPDGRRFAFVTKDDAPNQKDLDAKNNGFDVGDNEWTLQAAPVSSHLWTIPVDGGAARRLTHGEFTIAGTPAWAPDGHAIYVTRYPTAYTEHYLAQTIVRVSPRDGAIVRLANVVNGIVFSRDGTRMAYDVLNPAAKSVSLVTVAAANGSHARIATASLDRDDQSVNFTPDDSHLIVSATDGTHTRIFRVDLTNGAAARLPLGNVDVSSRVDEARDGTLAFIGSTPSTANELYVLQPRANAPRRLTSLNVGALAGITFGKQRTIDWKSDDGFAPDGVLTEPAGGLLPGKRYPLVLVIHGGPTAASTFGFNPLAQLMAARGWLVFEPNYRGSNDLGARYAQATVPHITSAPAQDVEDGLAAVLKLGIVDGKRIGVSGWSEGGLLTSWLITHDTRWKAAMSGAAVNDWLMYADLTDAQDFTPSFIDQTSPFTSAESHALYESESPLTFADRVKTPTLIMTDAGDQRVPEPLAYMFYHAVRATGTPVKMVVYPVNGHFPSDPIRREDVLRRWVGWFATKL